MFESLPEPIPGLSQAAAPPAAAGPAAHGFPLFGRPVGRRRAQPVVAPVDPALVERVLGRLGTDVLDELGPAVVLDVLEVAAPCPQMVVLAHGLQSRVLTEFEASRLLSVWQRLESWLVSRMDVAIVDVAGEEPASSVDYGREEAALAMRMSPQAGMSRVGEARARTVRLPELGAALASAALTRGQAYDLTVAVARLDDTLARAVCERVLPVAERTSRAEFKTATAKAILLVDADGAATRHEKAKRERGVRIIRHPDAMAEIAAYVTAVEAEGIYDALHATALRDRAPGQRIDNARADALVTWATTAHEDPTLPRGHGRRSELRLTTTFDAFLGITNDPAYLDGYGPVHPMIARELAPGATLRRLLTDSRTGELLHFGRTTYRVPQALADHVIARDGTCRLVGCAQPARRCDLDHRTEWQDGGTTDPENLGPLCERHHVMRHNGNWRLVTVEPLWDDDDDDDGDNGGDGDDGGDGDGGPDRDTAPDLMWITPTGREYLVRREPVDPSMI